MKKVNKEIESKNQYKGKCLHFENEIIWLKMSSQLKVPMFQCLTRIVNVYRVGNFKDVISWQNCIAERDEIAHMVKL